MTQSPTTVTFLFTDVEGSTRRWEADPDGMRVALAQHDEALRAAIEGHGGRVFKHTGDGMCSVFPTAPIALRAAVDAQRALVLPVRMGLATGDAFERDGDYFGPVLNRAARVMAAGHGGQVLVAASEAWRTDDIALVDLGEHRLRDLSAPVRLFQASAVGLGSEFPPLRTADVVSGNLPVQLTTFIGRDVEMATVVDLIARHALVTLTGVGGVGKTRLALAVGAELAPEYPDGVWLAELGPVGDPAAVPDALATVFHVQPGPSVTESFAEAVSGRRLLLLLDNCEHVLDAAAALVEAILDRAPTVKILATSREGLGLASEQRWVVPPLDTFAGAGSAAVSLFVERARSVVVGFSLDDKDDAMAVADLCRGLDGIPLAIELAAARMLSMTPQEVVARLSDRFRVLGPARRGVRRHQTMRHAVQWSYDLLEAPERALLAACAAFADGFDLSAAMQLGDLPDEYTVLDCLDSLTRKSLLNVERIHGRTRYKMLETIRQYAEDELGDLSDVLRDRHASYFGRQAIQHWEVWNGPDQRVALDWVETEYANLRAAFRWSTERGDLATTVAIVAHTALLAWTLQLYEPVSWAEELLPSAVASDVEHLPRLYVAAGVCAFVGRPEEALDHAEHALELEARPRYLPFEPGWASFSKAVALRFCGRAEQFLAVCADMAGQERLPRLLGMVGLLYGLPNAGRSEEARAMADETLRAARADGNPWLIAFTLDGYGRALAESDPQRASAIFREGLEYAREHRLMFFEGFFVHDIAALEAAHGDDERALAMFEYLIDMLDRVGDTAHLMSTLANLVVSFDRLAEAEAAATIYGATTAHASITRVASLPAVVDDLRSELGDERFRRCLAAGARMEISEVVHFARHHVQLALDRARVSTNQMALSPPERDRHVYRLDDEDTDKE